MTYDEFNTISLEISKYLQDRYNRMRQEYYAGNHTYSCYDISWLAQRSIESPDMTLYTPKEVAGVATALQDRINNIEAYVHMSPIRLVQHDRSVFFRSTYHILVDQPIVDKDIQASIEARFFELLRPYEILQTNKDLTIYQRFVEKDIDFITAQQLLYPQYCKKEIDA